MELRASLSNKTRTWKSTEARLKMQLEELRMEREVAERVWNKRFHELQTQLEAQTFSSQGRTLSLEQSLHSCQETVRELSSTREQLHRELTSTRHSQQELSQESDSWRLTAVLTSLILVPLLWKNHELATQKSLVFRRLASLEELESEVRQVLLVRQTASSGLLRMRKTVLAIVAAIHWRRLASYKHFRTITSINVFEQRIPLALSLHRHGHTLETVPSLSMLLVDRLEDRSLSALVRDSTAELLSAMQSSQPPSSTETPLSPCTIDLSLLIQRTCESLLCVLDATGGLVAGFPPSQLSNFSSSLCHALGVGLHQALHSSEEQSVYTPAKRGQISKLVHDLSLRASQSFTLQQNLNHCQEKLQLAVCQTESLQKQLSQSVPLVRHGELQQELMSALRRERESHDSLAQRHKDVGELQDRITLLCKDLQNKERAASQTAAEVESLQQSVMELKAQLHETSNQLVVSKREKNSEAGQVLQLRDSLQQLTREKDILNRLLSSARTAFSESKTKVGTVFSDGTQECHLPVTLLSAAEEFARLRPAFAGEVDSCITTLRGYMEAHQCALSCLASQQEQLACCQEHIRCLKEELKGVCAREKEGRALCSSTDQS